MQDKLCIALTFLPWSRKKKHEQNVSMTELKTRESKSEYAATVKLCEAMN
jgi:hypothetical protein